MENNCSKLKTSQLDYLLDNEKENPNRTDENEKEKRIRIVKTYLLNWVYEER